MFCPSKRKSNGCNCQPFCKGSRRIRGQPRNKSLRRKLQYLFQPNLCCDRTCAIFGALDKPYIRSASRQCFYSPKRSKSELNSLGVPVGLICSNICIKPTKDPRVQSKRLEIYMKAFGLIYLLPENKWTQSNIDCLLCEDDNSNKRRSGSLVSFRSHTNLDETRLQLPKRFHGEHTPSNASNNMLKKLDQNRKSFNRVNTNSRRSLDSLGSTVESEVFFRAQSLEDTQQPVSRKFTIEDHEFTIELQSIFSGTKGRTQKSRTIISNLKIFLRDFFQIYRFCLFWTEEFGYLLIWRRRRAYFVLDINGRHKTQFTYKAQNRAGVAMLMCLKTLDNVVHLITRMSGISMTDMFHLRHLIVTRLETPDGKVYMRDTNRREKEYIVVSNDYAFLKSRLHLTLNQHNHLRNRSSVMVGVAAIIASKIDHPATWNTSVFDRIICHGVKICRNCWESCTRHTIDLDAFPTQLRMGQYVAELKLLPSVKSGNWRCSKPFNGNEYEHLLIGALEEYNSVLFQINHQMYAIWVSHGFYYLLDPFLHTIEEDATEGNIKPKSASLRMFGNKMIMLRTFHNLLIESNRSSTFYIHAVKIKNLQSVPYGFALIPVPDDSNLDVVSLNETICFPSDYQECMEDLSQFSDYELDVISFTEKPLDYGSETDEDEMGEMEENECEECEGIELSDDSDKLSKKKSKSKMSREPSLISKRESDTKPNSRKSKEIKFKPARATINATTQKELVQKIEAKKKSDVERIKPGDELEKERSTVKEQSVQKDRSFKNADKKSSQNWGYSKRNLAFSDQCSDNNDDESKRDSRTNDKSSRYPGYSKVPHDMAVCGSESGTIESITRLLRSAFKCAERVLMLTPWGNHVVFREPDQQSNSYYVFQGCVCNIDHFRHLDLRFGTAGLKPFRHQSQIVRFIIDSRESNALEMLRTRIDKSGQRLEKLKARGP